MALVQDNKRTGASTHALIVAVEASESGAEPFSPVASAIDVAKILRGIAINGAPVSTIELIASPPIRPESLAPLFELKTQPPNWAVLERAVHAWIDRLRQHDGNVGVFYYSGPTLDAGGATALALRPATGGGTPMDHVHLRNLWAGVGDQVDGPVLFFIDGCPTVTVPGSLVQASLMFQPAESPTAAAGRRRALFYSRKPLGSPKLSPGTPTIFSAALSSIMRPGAEMTGRELGAKFQGRLGFLLQQQRLKSAQPLEIDVDGLFSIRIQPATTDPHVQADEPGQLAPPSEPPQDGQSEPAPADPPARHEVPDSLRRSAPDRKTERAGPASRPGGTRARSSKADRLAALSKRQRQCLGLSQSGLSSPEIALRLGLDYKSVDRYISEAKRRLGPRTSFSAEALLAGTGTDAGSGDESAETAEPSSTQTHFVDDDPEIDRDDLGRGPLAVMLARRMHKIWCRSNGVAIPGDAKSDSIGAERAGFVLHLDAPWGGGKTTFANFLARVLNPFPAGVPRPARFLLEAINVPIERINDPPPLGTIFIDDPPAGGNEDTARSWDAEGRRPWIIVPFNAWRAEHCAPPWWVFYQAIRKGCLQAILAEGTAPAEPGATSAGERPSLAGRSWTRAEFLWRELWWRLRNPKVVTRLTAFAVAAFALLVLWKADVVFSTSDGPDFNAGNALGFLLAGIGGISGLWGLGALLTESMAPGLDDAAERRSLGSNDPLERFRRHFARTIAAAKRPVMVIIDDLDRCRPDFVVDLVRGIQTLLRSPRIVFVILGDRAWIERAFEAHHEAMKMINVGSEQSFGARFVQKAIQLSFILPEIPDDKQHVYVRRVLIGDEAAAAAEVAPPAPAALSQSVRDAYRQAAVDAGGSSEALEKAEKELQNDTAKRLMEACAPAQPAAESVAGEAGGSAGEAQAAAPAAPILTEAEAQAQAAKMLGKERAMLASVDEKIGQALLHRFEPLAPFFPANPRQIKRIANAITLYVCTAYMHLGWKQQDERVFELAIWITIMTEWPDTWRALAWWPELADHLAGETPAPPAADAATEGGGDTTATAAALSAILEREAARIRSEPMLYALISGKAAGRDGKVPPRGRLRTESVRYFVELTPLYSGNARPPADEQRNGSGKTA